MTNSLFDKAVALTYALVGTHRSGRCFHTSIIFRKNHIYAIGINNYNKLHPRHKFHQKNVRANLSLHSEIDAIIKLGEPDLSGYDMLNIRIDKNGMLAVCNPCTNCQTVLKQAAIRRVYVASSKGCAEFAL